MGSDSCRIGRRRCPRKGVVLVRNGDVVAEEAVVSGKSSGEESWRRVMMTTCHTFRNGYRWMLIC